METDTYRISLRINENLSEYDGSENIRMKVKDEEIVLNSVDINVKEISVNGKPVKFTMDKIKEELVLEDPWEILDRK